MLKPELIIVPELFRYVDERFINAYDALATVALGDIEPPELCRVDQPDTVAYGVLDSSPDKVDRHDVIVSIFPMANDLGKNMTIRHRFLLDSLDKPTRMVLFPHNTHQQPGVYGLSEEDRATIVEGSFASVAAKQLHTLQEMGVRRMRIVGDSVGSAMGTSLIQQARVYGGIEVGPSIFFESPNMVDRTTRELKRDFRAGGPGAFKRAVNQSGIPAYSEVQHTQGGLDDLALVRMFMDFGRNAQLPENHALIEGMTHAHMFHLVQEMERNPTLQLTLVRGANSRMFPKEVALSLWTDNPELSERLRVHSVVGRGHEVANHLPTFALLSRAALAGRGRSIVSTII